MGSPSSQGVRHAHGSAADYNCPRTRSADAPDRLPMGQRHGRDGAGAVPRGP